MADLKVLLTANLNVAQSTKDINEAIAKIQGKITKLKLQIDTKALTNAGVIIKGLGNNVAQANQQMANATQKASKMSKKSVTEHKADMQQIQSAMSRVNREIGKDTERKVKVTYSVDQKGRKQIKEAAITYANDMGKMITKNLGWTTSTVVKDVNGKMKEVTTKTFRQIGETVSNSTNQATKKMDFLLQQASKLRGNVASGRTNVNDKNDEQRLLNSYAMIEQKIKSAQSAGTTLHEKTLKNLEAELRQNKEITSEIIRQQKIAAKTANLGRTVIGSSNGFNFNTSNQNIISGAQSSLNNYLSANNLKGSASASNFNIDSVKIDNAGKAVATLTAKIKTAEGEFQTYKIKIDQASDSTRIFGERTTQMTKTQMGFMDQLKVAMARIPIWMVGMTAFYGTLHLFQDGVKYVNELNKSLTELSIVFNQSQSEVAQYAGLFHELGMEMGISTEEIAKGAVEFARQGLKGVEMLEKMKTATIYAKISNIDFTESAKIMTATVNSMGVTAERAADVYSYMGDATATGADEIGRAMQKVGGTAGAIGIEFEKVSSWIATVSSRTRESAETIGSSVKSIIARVQSLKERGFDEEDGTQVNQVAKALDKVGIKLIDAQGEFRNFGTVMDELGGKWGTLTNRQQAYLATTIAGSYQQSRFLNIMEGYPASVQLYEESLTKAGIANEKFNRYQEGTEAHLEKMKVAWTGIFQSSFDSDGIRNIIDMLTNIGVVINRVVDVFGTFPIVVGAATIAFAIFGRTAYNTLGTKMAGAIMHPATALGLLKLNIQGATASMLAQGAASRVLSASLKVLALTARSLVSAFAPLLLFAGVAFAVQKVTEAISKHNAKVKELKTVSYAQREELSEQRQGLKDLAEEYNNLMTTEGKTIEQKNRMLAIQNELVSKYGVTASGIDAEGNAFVNSVDAIQERVNALDTLIKKQDELNKAKIIGNFSENSEDIRKKRDEYEQNMKILDALRKKQVDYANGERTEKITKTDSYGKTYTVDKKLNIEDLNKEIAKAMENKDKAEKELKDLTGGTIDSVRKTYLAQLEESGKTITNEQRSFITGLTDIVGQMNFTNFESQVKFVGNMMDRLTKVGITSTEQLKAFFADQNMEFTASNFSNFAEVIKSLEGSVAKNISLTDMQTEAYKTYGLALGITKESMDGIVSSYVKGTPFVVDNADAMAVAVDSTQAYAAALNSLQSVYEKSSETVKVLNGFLEDNANGKQISSEAVMDLIEKDSSLISLFKIENGVIKLNTKAVLEKKDALIQSVKAEGAAQRESLATQNAVLIGKLSAWGLEIDAMTDVGEAIDAITAKTNNLVYLAGKMEEDGLIPGLLQDGEDAKALVQAYSDIQAKQDLATAAMETMGETADKTTESMSALQKAIDKVDAALAQVESNKSRYAKSSKEYKKAIQEEINLLKEKEKLYLEAQKNPSKLMPTTTTTTSGGTVSTYTGGTGAKSSGNLKDIITSAANKNGIDVSILDAIAYAESNYNPNAKSGAGASGLMQLMPGTAKGLGVTNVFDPSQSANGGALYLSQLYKKYGSYDLALAAYNAGPGFVDWAIKVTGSKDWNVLKNAKADKVKYKRSVGDNIFKQETINYVPKVLNYAAGGKSAPTTSLNTQTSTSTSSSSSSKDTYNTEKTIESSLLEITNRMFAATREMLDSDIATIEMGIENKDKAIAESQYRQQSLNPDSKEFAIETDKQIAQMKVKQKLIHDEAELIRNSGIQSDDLTQKVTSLSQAWRDEANKIKALNDLMADNSISKFTKKIEETDNALALSAATMNAFEEGSARYRIELGKQVELNKVKQKQLEEEANKIRAILSENSKSNKLTVEKVAEYNVMLRELKIAWWDVQAAIVANKKAFEDMNKEIGDEAVDLIKEMYEKQKDALLKATDEQDDILEKAHEKEMDRIDEKLEADQKVIDSAIRKLEFDQKESDYLDSLNKKSQTRQELQDKINRLSMDNSTEGKAQLKELIKQRDEIDEDIEKTQNDHSIETQKQDYEDTKTRLDEEAQAKKDAWGMTITLWDASQQKMVEISGKTYDELKDIVEEYKDATSQYFEDIANDEKRWSDLRKNVEAGNIGEIEKELGGLKGWFDINLPLVGKSIYDSITMKLQEVIDKLKLVRNESSIIAEMQKNSAAWAASSAEQKKVLEAANSELGSSIGATRTSAGVWLDASGNPLYGGTTTTTPSASTTTTNSTTISKMKANQAEWHTASDARKAELVKANEALGKSIGLSKKPDGHWYDKSGMQVLHKGGIVGGGGDALTNTMNKMLNTDADEQVILALQDELMSPSKNIASKFLPNMNKLISSILPSVSVSSGGNTYHVSISGFDGSEKNADGFAKKLVKELKKIGG